MNNRLIWEISEQLHNITNPAETMNSALEIMMQASGAEASSIWLLDETINKIRPVAFRGPRVDGLSEIILDLGEGICGTCIQSGEPIAVGNVSGDSRWTRRADSKTGYKTTSMLSVPLKLEGRPSFGCVQLLNKKDGSAFDSDNQIMAALVADMISHALAEQGFIPQIKTNREVVLSVRNVSRHFGKDEALVKALDDVSFDIYKGEMLVILGSSGSGKSTLLNIIGGMDRPTKGQVIVGQQDISQFNERQITDFRKDKIGFVFQFYNLISDLTAEENVTIAAGLSKNPLDVMEALRMVNMEHRKDKYPLKLSGGEQQRVSIARALVKNATFMLCDEPTGALDFTTGKQVLKSIVDLVHNHQQTVVVVTHCTPIASVADRVIKLHSGHIVEQSINPSPADVDEIEW